MRNPSDEPNMIGLVSPVCSPKAVAEQAVRDAAYMCSRTYGDAPEVTFHGRPDLVFPYVPSHLSYVLLELLKNSMRATVETHGVDNMPPIRIVISGADGEGTEDVSVFVYKHYFSSDRVVIVGYNIFVALLLLIVVVIVVVACCCCYCCC